MSVTQELKIEGDLKISLYDYEKLVKNILVLRKEAKKNRVKSEALQKPYKELASFINHMARNVKNFDHFVNAFNEVAVSCEIHKTDDNKYLININGNYDEKGDEG